MYNNGIDALEPMNLLFVTDGTYPYLTANSEIVFRVSRILRDKYNCNIEMLMCSDHVADNRQLKSCEFKVSQIRSIPTYKEIEKSSKSRIMRRFRLLMHPECYRYLINSKRNDKNYIAAEYKHAMQSLLNRKHYDCIIVVSVPWAAAAAAAPYVKTNVPYIHYQLDPWSTHYAYYKKDNRLARESELKTNLSAGAIIVTDLIMREIKNNLALDLMNKYHVLNFPCVCKHNANSKELQKGKIHCFFVGRFYDEIRNPKYLFQLFHCLINDNIVLHIVGHFDDDFSLTVKCSPNIVFHGPVSSDESISYMQSADILVNVGNTVPNMMPSKLLTYISLGKPILNLIKCDNCPTLPYMEKYPFALNVLETDEPTSEDITHVRDFILYCKGRNIPFEAIKEIYYDCTPEYVGGKMYDIICNVVDTNRRK